MKIIWYSTRNHDDLCATTAIALANGLVELGHDLTIVNPDSKDKHDGKSWKHISINLNFSLPGGRARKISKILKNSIKQNGIDADVCLIDWAIAPSLGKLLSRYNIPMVLIDRSPPAYSSLLAKFQWPVWTNAWSLVRNGVIHSGCVVSPAHRAFVAKKCKVQTKSVYVLPAGVDCEKFSPLSSKDHDVLKFIYHGRLDKNRGILSLPMFIQRLNSAGILSKLTLIGEGDLSKRLGELAKENEWLTVQNSIPHFEIGEVIHSHHIGLLPMPDRGVWPLASPLKRGEYLASGLMVLGIDHKGHRLEGTDSSWYHLLKQEDFHVGGEEWARKLTPPIRAQKGDLARRYAEEHLTWAKAITALQEAIETATSSQGNL
ncbi:glycosyltransferase [Candidatus Poseidonia alphae]|nr:glycosyltransferase [Candidatus Poseidonia alphae]